MKEIWNENIKIQLHQLMPVIFTVLFIIIFNIPKYPFVSDSIRPSVSIIFIYFWLIYQPYAFNIVSIYLVGVLEDIIASTPFGTNIFTILFLYVMTRLISKFVANKPFIVVWYGFAVVTLATLIAKWLVVSIYYSQFLPISTLIFSFLTTVAFYPLFSIINIYIYDHLIQGEEK